MDLLETIIPFFQRYPLRSAKQQDFEVFVSCMALVSAGAHRTPSGLVEIARLTEAINRQKPRADLIRILRGHTPDARDTG